MLLISSTFVMSAAAVGASPGNTDGRRPFVSLANTRIAVILSDLLGSSPSEMPDSRAIDGGSGGSVSLGKSFLFWYSVRQLCLNSPCYWRIR